MEHTFEFPRSTAAWDRRMLNRIYVMERSKNCAVGLCQFSNCLQIGRRTGRTMNESLEC